MRPRTLIWLLCLVGLAVALSTACSRDSSKASTPAGSAATVSGIAIGRSIDSTNRVADETDTFGPNDTLYVSIRTEGTSPQADLRARWTYEDGQMVDESSRQVALSGSQSTEFHVQKPDGWPPGRYKVEIFLNGVSTGAKDFQVR